MLQQVFVATNITQNPKPSYKAGLFSGVLGLPELFLPSSNSSALASSLSVFFSSGDGSFM